MFKPRRIILNFRKGKDLLSGWGEEFSALWNLARNLVLAIGILLFFFVAVEIIKFYRFLSSLDPTLAIPLTIIVLVALSWFPIKLALSYMRTPSSIVPPGTTLSMDLDTVELVQHRLFLAKFLARLSNNRMLGEEERDRAKNGLAEVRSLKTAKPKDLITGLLKVRQTFVVPLVNVLDGKAKEEVRKAAVHISGGVMASPYQSVDALIAVGRSTGMALRIIRIYYARPTIKETVLILVDVVRVAAFVNILNIGGMAFRSLSATPVVGWVISAATQGFGAGLFVLVIGKTTRMRCQALEKWDVEKARLGIKEKMSDFSGQARSLVFDGMSKLREKAPEAMRKGWDATEKTVSASLDIVVQSASSAVMVARETAPKVKDFGTQAAKIVTDSTIKSAKKTAEIFGSANSTVVRKIKTGKWFRKRKYVPPERSANE